MRCGRVGWVGGGSARSRVRHLAWHVASWCWVAMQRATWPRAAERLRPLSRRTHSSARTNPRAHPHTTCTQAFTRTQTRTQTRTCTTSSDSPGGSLRYASAAHTAQHIYQQSLPQRATSPVPHLHREWAHPATSAPRPGSPPPHLHRDRDVQRRASQTTCARPRRRSRHCRKPRSRCCGTSGPSQRIASRYFSSCRVLVCVAPLHCRALFGHFGGRRQLVPYWCVTMKHGKDSDCYGRLSYYRQHDTVHS
jgi:hypothetical protein